MSEIGQFRHVVVFKINTPVTKGAGAKDGYSTLLTTRGKLSSNGGSRGLQFGEINEASTYTLLVRYQSDLETNLSSSMKVEIDSRTFTVNSWQKIEEKNFYYKIALSEQRN